jgi:hypothetical protein
MLEDFVVFLININAVVGCDKVFVDEEYDADFF